MTTRKRKKPARKALEAPPAADNGTSVPHHRETQNARPEAPTLTELVARAGCTVRQPWLPPPWVRRTHLHVLGNGAVCFSMPNARVSPEDLEYFHEIVRRWADNNPQLWSAWLTKVLHSCECRCPFCLHEIGLGQHGECTDS